MVSAVFAALAMWIFLTAVGWSSSVGLVQVTEFPFEREHLYANQIFFIPSWLVLAWYAAGGLDEVLGWLGQVLGEEGDEPDDAPRRALAPPRWRRLAHATAALAVIALVSHSALAHYRLADRSETRLVADYGRAILDVMDEGVLYLPASDHSTFAAMYWQGVQGHRPDVVFADKYGRIPRSRRGCSPTRTARPSRACAARPGATSWSVGSSCAGPVRSTARAVRRCRPRTACSSSPWDRSSRS